MVIARSTRLNLANLSEHLVTAMPWLDSVAEKMHAAWNPLFGAEGPIAIKDALYGTWLGHPLHPVLTDLPIGFWTTSAVLDAAGLERGSDLTLKLGTVSALATAVTGYAQWHDLQNLEAPRRLGTLHAMLNITATACYGASWVLRDRGDRTPGLVLSTTGLVITSVSGLLGGDLAYKLGIGVSRVAFEEPAGDWAAVIGLADLADGTLTRVENEGDPLVLLKDGATVYAASATCTHVGGPLDEGELSGTCVTCPWHGSEFDLRNGRVIHGPATSPIHANEARVTDGQVEVRVNAPT